MKTEQIKKKKKKKLRGVGLSKLKIMKKKKIIVSVWFSFITTKRIKNVTPNEVIISTNKNFSQIITITYNNVIL